MRQQRRHLVSSLSAASVATGLVAAWTYETGGNLGLDSAGSNHLTNNNAATQVTGKVGSGVHFASASSQSLSRASTASLVLANTSWELTTWFKHDDPFPGIGFFPGIVAKWGGTDLEYLLYYDGGAQRITGAATADGATPATVVGTGAMVAGNWYFCDLYFDWPNTTLHLEINGVPGDTPTVPLTNTFAGTQSFTIGSSGFGAPYLDAAVDGTHLWRRLLTIPERAALYNGGAGREYPFGGV